MKRKMHSAKLILSIVLCFAIILAYVPSSSVTVFAANTESEDNNAVVSGSCGDTTVNGGKDVQWTLTGDETNGYTLTISGTGAMEDYGYSGEEPWYSHIQSITTVVIEDGVTSIGEWAFSSCSSLTSVTISDSVTSIGNYAFSYCSGLTSVTIPASVTSIGNYAFGYCSSLTEITIPDSVENIGESAFRYCSSLTEITIPASVTSIGVFSFLGCESLTEITIPASVTSIGDNAFYNCSSLTSVNIPNGVTTIGEWAFCGCSGLTEITIPDSVENIGGGAFNSCSNLCVHYLGTKDQWKTVTEGVDDPLSGTKGIHYVGSDKPTCTTDVDGSTHSWHCSEEGCNAVIKTERHINTEVKNAKAATCTADGYTGDTYCKDCKYTAKGTKIPMKDHTWDAGVVTKEATTTEKGVKTYTCSVCKTTKVEEIPVLATKPGNTTKPTGYDTAEKTEKTITTANTDKGDVKGSTFAKLQLKAEGKSKSVKLTWKKVKNADGYILYSAQCGKKLKKLKTFTGASKVKYTQNKLKREKYYKYMVVAYKKINGKKYTIATSKTVHAVTSGGKYADPSKVTVTAEKLSIKKGAKKNIKAGMKLPKNKKLKVHIAKFRYESDNTKVATVTSKGVVKGKKKGTANIYVYAQNGAYKKVKVTVK